MDVGAMREPETGEETIRDQEMALEAATDRAQGTVLVLVREMETDQEVGTEEMKRIHASTQRGLSGHRAVRAARPADLELFL